MINKFYKKKKKVCRVQVMLFILQLVVSTVHVMVFIAEVIVFIVHEWSRYLR